VPGRYARDVPIPQFGPLVPGMRKDKPSNESARISLDAQGHLIISLVKPSGEIMAEYRHGLVETSLVTEMLESAKV